VGEQFYVTHCATADSAMNAPGYSVRASSALGDTDALRQALEYPPYELPLEMWKEKPTKANAPRRLTRTKHPDSGVWVVHSVYLEKDTMNRDRSYFSHLLHLAASVDATAVLESWGAEEWATEYAPGAAKKLAKGKLPVGTRLSEANLSAFLSRPQSGATELSTAVCPARLRSNPELRRELVARFLHAFILVVEAKEADEPRDRLFVHAEPGLVAMLLYAAVTILPPNFTSDLTFSTFEPAHRGIRDFKLATVIGTYLGGTNKGLDIDLTTTRGYGLDTITPARSSKELADLLKLPPGLSDLIELAALGEWNLVLDVHRLLHGETDPLPRVPQLIPLARAVNRLSQGKPTTEDLLTLKADRRGNTVLTRESEKVWAYLRGAALTDERLRTQFRDWLANPDCLNEYRREAAELLVNGDLAGWDMRWGVVRETADAEQKQIQADKARKSLDQYIPNMPLAARDRLRAACAESGAWPDHHLLAPTSPAELESLLAKDSPAEWQGYACFAVMAPEEKNWLAESTRPYRSVMRERARRHLMAAPAAVLGGYLQQAKPFVTSDPTFIYDLLRPHRPECIGFLSRLIDGGADRIEPADWVKLLGDLDVYGERAKEWQGFLLRNDHLAKLLIAFRTDPCATSIWEGYLTLVSAELFDGDDWETRVFGQLSKAKEKLDAGRVKLRPVLPPGGEDKLNAADTILAVIANPAIAEKLAPGQLTQSFKVFGLDPLDGLRKVYYRGGFAGLALPRDASTLAAFITAFRACYPVTHEYYAARTAVTQWLAFSETCPEEMRAEFQVMFVRDCIPKEWHQATLDEPRHYPFLPEAEARIRQMILAARKPQEQYSRPAARSNSLDDVTHVSSATKRAKATRGPGRNRRARRDTGVGVLLWVILGLLMIGGLIVAIVIMVKQEGKPRPTEPDTTPPPAVQHEKDKKDKDKDKPKDKDKKDKGNG
jgi:hypothetical protein